MSGRVFLDPEVRRVLLEEIACQRAQRSRYRARPGSYWQELAARRNHAIHVIREVWDRLEAVERRRLEEGLAADPSDWSPGELQEAWGR